MPCHTEPATIYQADKKNPLSLPRDAVSHWTSNNLPSWQGKPTLLTSWCRVTLNQQQFTKLTRKTHSPYLMMPCHKLHKLINNSRKSPIDLRERMRQHLLAKLFEKKLQLKFTKRKISVKNQKKRDILGYSLEFSSDVVNGKTLFPANVVYTTHNWHDTIDAVRSIVQVRWNSWYGHQDASAYNTIVSW